MLTVKILGSGCANCKRLEAVTRQVIVQMGMEVDVVKVTEFSDIMAYNIMSTPGLVINEKLVSAGRIPSPAEISTWLATAVESA
jgi:small redox-active disulfide protein 2